MIESVLVLMSTYNGGKYIEKQLDTLFSQKNVDVSVLVRDDGSTDNTLELIRAYNSPKITIIEGTNLGFAQSFWNLVKTASGYDYYAFCDQDDIWHDDKLATAIEMLKYEDIPTLYTSDVIMVNNDLGIINKNGFSVNNTLSCADSLKKSILPGCTFVFNQKLIECMKRYDGFMISHDWTCYIIATFLGKVVFDPKPHMYYRIHGNNTIGYNNKFQNLLKRIRRFFGDGQRNTRSEVASLIYQNFKHELNEDKKELLYNFVNCNNSMRCKMKLLKYKEYREIAFLMMLFLGRV